MEDATIENGCLCVIPGSHKLYPLQERFIKNNEGTQTHFIDTDERRVAWNLDKLQPVPVKTGSLVLLHGEIVHASYANVSSKSRHAFVLHLVDKSANWPIDNWLQRPSNFPFRDLEEIVNTMVN
jgi:phytanoyl-CoA hydroxylase